MRQEERTQIYFNEALDNPKDGDSWAFYDGVWCYKEGKWYFPKN